MADTNPVLSSLSNGVFRIVLNRPRVRNALSLEMIAAVTAALDEADSSDDARVIVIAAEGPVFSSGHDLKELTAARSNPDGGREFFALTMGNCSAMMQRIVSHRLPVIAEVMGTASAAGCQLVASCDLAVASTDAKFITPGVNIGLFCSTPMVALSRNVAPKHAMEMLLTGDHCSAEKAAETGLINKAVEANRVTASVKEYTDQITAKSKMTLKTGKEAFYNQLQMPLHEAYDYCSAVMVDNMMKNDAREGIGAFLEKRAPEWKDE